jgi:hypothetical protein
MSPGKGNQFGGSPEVIGLRPHAVGLPSFSERFLTSNATKAQFRRRGMPYEHRLPPLFQKGHSGIRVRRFVGCILEETLLFPVAYTGLRERIRVPAAVDFLRSLGEQ